jgi:hypothetical protein
MKKLLLLAALLLPWPALAQVGGSISGDNTTLAQLGGCATSGCTMTGTFIDSAGDTLGAAGLTLVSASTIAFSGGSTLINSGLIPAGPAIKNGANPQNLYVYNDATHLSTFGAVSSVLTSLSVGGATIGSNALAVTGKIVGSSTLNTGTITADQVSGASIYANSTGSIGNVNRGVITFPSDGVFTLWNNANTGFTRLQLGGTTSSFPAIKVNGAALNFRLADDSADAAITAAAGTFSGAVAANTTLNVGGVAATLATGETGGAKITASGSAPGAGTAKFERVAGTNAGSCKMISYAGTSTTPVTIVDNVGSGC